MTIVLSLLLIISLVINGIFFWYTRKIVFNLSKAVDGMDEMQKLFTEYASFLEPLANLENYYGEPAIDSARANTRLVIEGCKMYKKSILENYDEENQENQDLKENESAKKEDIPKRGAIISSVKS